MPVIRSKLKTDSAEFKAAAEGMRAQVRELEGRLATVCGGGGATARERHTARGKLLPRERIARLIDAGSAFFDRASWSRSCPPGTAKWDTPDMLHVWLIDNPNGPFDSDMDPADVAGILAASAPK